MPEARQTVLERAERRIHPDVQVTYFRGADALQAIEDDRRAMDVLREWSRTQP
jgi:hypothetical protein